jgi:hypothetical protein
MRDFDFVQGAHDVLVAFAGFASDVTSGLPYTVLGGLVASQTVAPSLTVNISAGRIYQFASSDLVGVGSIPQDLTTIVQQGFNPAQSLTLIAPSSGQSQWNLIQAQFSQVDAVRTNDPNGGIVPFYNAANPTQPTLNSINTVRKGACVLQVVTGSAATTGSEVPPNPTSGWVPLYMIDLAGGQTQITTSQIITCGPSVGTGVSSTYPVAPFLAGFLASHHSGRAGQAPQIKLGSEVQGILPYANMSAVRTLLNSALTLYVNNGTGSDTNTGLTPSVPFKTIQAAVNAGYRNYDFNGNTLTISVANGSYAAAGAPNVSLVTISGMPLGCTIFNLVGNNASPGSVSLSVTSGLVMSVSFSANINLSGFSLAAGGSNTGFQSYSGYGLNVSYASTVTISNMVFGACGTAQVQCLVGSTVVYGGPVSHTGATGYAMLSQVGAMIYNVGQTVTVTGLSMTVGFAVAISTGFINYATNTFVGSATGPRYNSSLNGVIAVNSGGINYFPGSVAGTTATGGQYG